MRHVALACVLAACGNSTTPELPDAPADSPANGGMVTNVSGTISANATWLDNVNVTGALVIAPGVTVTVMPGTTIAVASTAYILLQGTLDIEGTSASKVTIGPNGGANWLGFRVPTGGSLIMHYAVETGGGITTSGGSATVIDTQLSHAQHDLLVMAGGTVDVEYSWIGVEPPLADTTHCDMHMANGSGGANTIKVVHSNISTAVYGVMFYAGSGSDFTYNNWFSNGHDVDTLVSNPVSGNFSFGWFQKGTGPSGTGITANSLSASRLTDAGPRP